MIGIQKSAKVKSRALFAAACLSVALWANAATATVIDQDFLPVSSSTAGTSNPGSFLRAQSFTVGRTGRLIQAGFLLSTLVSSDLTGFEMQVLSTTGGAPNFGSVLASGTSFSLIDVGIANTQLAMFDISGGGLAVMAGQVLALHPIGPAVRSWQISTPPLPDLYTAGSNFILQPGMSVQMENFDGGFRTVIPEPTTALIFGFGIAALGFASRSKARERGANRPTK